MPAKPKPTLSSLSVRPSVVTTPPKVTPPGSESAEDRKLTTLRFTYAQRRYLKKVAFDDETTVQEWIVAAIDARLASRGLDTLESLKG